jgi:hypothetical protein
MNDSWQISSNERIEEFLFYFGKAMGKEVL